MGISEVCGGLFKDVQRMDKRQVCAIRDAAKISAIYQCYSVHLHEFRPNT